MNELEKKQHFSMKNLSDTVTTTPIRDDIYQLEPLKEVIPPKYKTLSQAYREFSFRKEMIDDIQSAIEKEPDATWTEKVGAGVDRAVLRIKQSPAQVRNLFYRTLYSGIDYPNADMKQALDIAEASAYQMYLENQSLSGQQQREGTADSIIANLTEGGLSLGEFALLNFATGGTVGTAIMGAQEAGSLSQQFAESDIEKGQLDTKGTIKENITAIAYGALAGWIEKGIGAEAALGQTWREILKSGGKSAVAKTFGKEAAKRGLGEGTEEFLQGEAEWAAGKFVGKEQRTFYDGMMDSLISGVYGAILGGAFGGVSSGFENGVTRYYKARSDMIERMTSAGMNPDVAANLADQALTDTTSLIVDELSGRNSLHAHFGEDWDKLVDGVAQAYITQGWQEKNPDKDVLEFARMNAVAMVAPVIQLSNRTNTPLKQILDLTKFRANQNALFIDLPNMDDPKALGIEIKNRKAEIKRLRGLPATDTAKRVKQLREQIKILELRLESLENYNALQKSRMNAKKANLDNNVLASTKPEVMANLQNIRQASDNESFVYVGNNQVPVRYVVKPMAEVQASHVAGEPNPNYTLKELQNRTRGTVTDDAILQNRAANLKPEELAESPNTQYGAPVVNKNGEVISGNGRIETLRRAYELGNTSYKEMLDKLGYNTEGIERPVLVRETVDDLTPEQQVAIAEASNVSETSAFDHARQAMNDAKLLRKGVSDPLALADELPVNERQAYIRENGQYDMLALQRRFDDAVLAWIIGDTKTFDSLVLSNRLSQKVVKGLSLQGGNIVEFSKNNPALGIKKDLRYALVKSASIKNRGQFLGAVMQQDVEEGVTFNADAMLYAMIFSNNSSELSNFLGDYIQTHQGYIDGQKDSFLADSLPKLSKEDITHQVLLKNPLTASKFDKTGLCTDGNLKAVITNKIPVEDIGYGTIKVEPEKSQLFQEQLDLANENARLDDIYPAYEGETININGQEKTVYNSNGDRIAKSEQALRNFYKWFGDSKVVDEQGRPLVVYHGTTSKFDVFYNDKPIWVTPKEKYASMYSDDENIMALYVKMENPANLGSINMELDEAKAHKLSLATGISEYELNGIWEKVRGDSVSAYVLTNSKEFKDALIERGFDGVEAYEGPNKSYAVFNPNQIKSTSNRGTYSLVEDNIYLQEDEYHILPDEIKNQELKIIEIDDKNIKTKEEVRLEIQRLIDKNTKEKTKDGKVIRFINSVRKKSPSNNRYKVARHIAYSSKGKQPAVRENATFDILNLIKNSVFVEEDTRKQDKKGYDKALRFYAAVRAGNDVYPVRIVALHREDTDSFDFSGDVYDVIFEEKKRKATAPDTSKEATSAGQPSDKIIISDLLDYVKASDEKIYKQKKTVNGFFDGELKTIVIGSSFNYGTLQHEFAHFFLDRIFDIYKTGAGTAEFNEWFSQLSSILDIKADQSRLTTEQQEHFARMTEAYLFNKGVFPENAKPAMQMFFDWCPTEYNELLSIGYKDENGVYHNSIFNKESLEFFDEMYSLVPTLSDSPTARTFTNDTNRNGTKLHTNTEMVKERERIISDNEVVPEEPKLEDQSPEVIQKTLEIKRMPDPEVESAYTEALEVEKERKKTLGEKFTQYVRIGRGTNTREEMDRVAQEYIKNNRENAERVAFGNPIPSGLEEETGNLDAYVDNNTGIDRAVLILNMMKEYPETSAEYGQLYHNFAIYRSYASKSAGLTNDISTNYYLKGYAEINKALQEKAALVRYGKANNAVNLWNRDIDRFISQNIDKVYNTEPESAEREKAIQQFIDDATATFAGDKLLYQEDLRISKAKDKRAFIDWANRTVRQIAKGKISGIDQAELLRLSIEAQKGASFIDSNDINEAVAASQAIRAWQDFVNNKGVPEKLMDKIIGSYLPSAMLSSPSTHALNYISNTFNNLAVKIASRLHYGANLIDNEVLQQEYQRLKAIYAESGHNISEDIKPDDISRLHGENWQFKKPTSKIGYLAPMRLLGWSDFNFRAHTYIDVLSRIASSDAKGDPKKALELFNAYKMMNNTGRAKEARVEAIMTGHIAVFTKNGVLSNVSSRVRAGLDYINLVDPGKAGHKGLGTLVMPFAKVPANIVGMGIEAVASPFKLLGKWTGLKQDWTLQDTINLTNFGMYASIVGIYLMAGLDYEPPYEPPAKYEPQKPYDSIKIGNAWVSVESFGALANPLRFTFTMLDMLKNGKKMDQALVKAADGLKNDIPFLSVDFENDYMKRKPADWLVSTTYNQVSKGVPAILKKPIAWMNREFGIEISQNSALKKKIARQYGLDGEQTTINDYLSWIYRGIKIER